MVMVCVDASGFAVNVSYAPPGSVYVVVPNVKVNSPLPTASVTEVYDSETREWAFAVR